MYPSLFPFDSSTNVLEAWEHVNRRLTSLSPDLTARVCVRFLSEMALFESVIDAEEGHIRHMAKLQHARLGMLI